MHYLTTQLKEMTNSQSILIIGKPGSSKTTYLAQFVTIARKAKSKITFWKTPENIQPLEDAIKRLRSGEETQSTPADSNLIISLPVTIENSNIEIICPDYGGEQINQILNVREINPYWIDLILKSYSWIIFIRPQSINKDYDLSSKSYFEANLENNDVQIPEFKTSEQASIIELIQLMLRIKKVSIQSKIILPKICIALTCWDEIENKITPAQFLKDSMPLLYQFIFSNWDLKYFKIMGVSAQGLNLKTTENKEKYLDEGPEKFAFVVKDDTTKKIPDLTLLIAEAL
jgi:hypothetical protein